MTRSAPEPCWVMPAVVAAKQNPSRRYQHSSWSPPRGAHLDKQITLALALHPWQCQPSAKTHRAWHPPGAWETPAGPGEKQLPLLCWHCVPGRGQRVLCHV